MMIHLGDCWQDADPLEEQFPEIPLVRVPGNCDSRLRDKTERILDIEGKRILICHGHTYGVKQGLWDADEIAEERHLDAFLFGHTHKPLVEMRGHTLFLNPGSIGLGHPRTYAVMEFTSEGGMDVHTVRADQRVRV